MRGATTVDSVTGATADQVDVLIADHPAPRVIDSRDRERHMFDSAALLACIDDPFAERTQYTGSDRRRIGALAKTLNATHPAWRALPARQRTQAQLTLSILAAADGEAAQ